MGSNHDIAVMGKYVTNSHLVITGVKRISSWEQLGYVTWMCDTRDIGWGSNHLLYLKLPQHICPHPR